VKQASCSPDGRHVAYLSDAAGVAQLYIVEVATPENVTQLTDFREPVQFAMFSPVANQIAFGMARGGDERMQIFVIDVDSREVSSVTNLPLVIHRWGGWSPDGQWVTYASNGRTGDDFDVYVHNVRTNESRCVFAPGGWCDSVGFSATGRYVIGRVQHTLHTHDMHVIDLQNNDAATHITPHDGVAEYEEPRWLPGDTAVIYSGSTNREFMGLECYDMQNRSHSTL
jgi:Tol biopolymer transport system component